MSKKQTLLLISAGIIIVLSVIAAVSGLFKDDTIKKGLSLSYSYCLDTLSGVSITGDDAAYREAYYQCCLIDSQAHYYMKSIIFQTDTFSISTLNYPNEREALADAAAASGNVTAKKPIALGANGFKIFSSINEKYLSRIFLPDSKFETIAVFDYFGNDSLKVHKVFEEELILKFVSKCH